MVVCSPTVRFYNRPLSCTVWQFWACQKMKTLCASFHQRLMLWCWNSMTVSLFSVFVQYTERTHVENVNSTEKSPLPPEDSNLQPLYRALDHVTNIKGTFSYPQTGSFWICEDQQKHPHLQKNVFAHRNNKSFEFLSFPYCHKQQFKGCFLLYYRSALTFSCQETFYSSHSPLSNLTR